MGFRNAIVSGVRLVREAIQSIGYIPGSSGWSINRDGSAEFSDATVRGTIDAAQITGGTITGADIIGGTIDGAVITGGDLLISGGGASVHVGVDPSDGALAEFTPQEIPGQTTLPARIFTFISGSTVTAMRLQGPKLGATVAPHIDLLMRISEGDITLRATGAGSIELNTEAPTNSARVNRNGISLLPNVELASVNIALTKAATSTGYGTITGLSFSFTKKFSDTRLVGYLSVGGFLTGAGNSSFEFAIRINNADHSVFILPINPIGEQFFRSGEVEIPAASVPAGTYTVTCRWRGNFGTGTLDAGGNRYIMRLMEVAP